MENNFIAGSISVAPGSKVQEWLPVVNSNDKIPVTMINGAKPGKTVVVTAGVHGGEYSTIETAIRLANEIDPAAVSGRIAIISCANIEGFFTKTMYFNPLDGKNLNRVFPGKALGTISERIAYTISSLFYTQADFVMDLHAGDIHEDLQDYVIYPSIGSAELVAISREMAGLYGLGYASASSSNLGTYGSAADMGIPGILAEVGRNGRWNEHDVELVKHGFYNVLYALGVMAGEVQQHPCVYFSGSAQVTAPATGIWHPEVKREQTVTKGDRIGEIIDLFGNQLAVITAPASGVMIYVITSLAINEGQSLGAVCEHE